MVHSAQLYYRHWITLPHQTCNSSLTTPWKSSCPQNSWNKWMGNFDIIRPGRLPMVNSIPEDTWTKQFDSPSLKARGQNWISSHKTAKSNNYECYSFQPRPLSSKGHETKINFIQNLGIFRKRKGKTLEKGHLPEVNKLTVRFTKTFIEHLLKPSVVCKHMRNANKVIVTTYTVLVKTWGDWRHFKIELERPL